uniref:Lysophosphatidylcholine acyltransferase 1 n=1 Tax=Fundulus heteroclitus TaxID=8078 RepID=A0A3Q2PS12_FUNHE
MPPPHLIRLPPLEKNISGSSQMDLLSSNYDRQPQGAGDGELACWLELQKSTRFSFLMLLAWGLGSLSVQQVKTWKAMWFCGGFHWIKVKGERAQPSEVPILTVAPHSSYFDAIPVTMTMCSIVTKLESRSIPIWGSNYIRPVFVFRSDQHSRRKTVEEIKRRAQSGGSWPQIMIFPEGTCTNRSGLILFKAGAFIPGLPVQPVVLRYPNKLVSILDALPPCFKAAAVRTCIPVRLGSPAFKCLFFFFGVQQNKLFTPPTLHSTQSLSLLFLFFYHGRLKAGTRDNVLEEEARRATKLQGDRLGLEDFAQFLNLPVTDALRQVHNLFDQAGDGKMDVRHYVIALSTVQGGEVAEDDLASILEIMLGVKEVELSPLLLELQAAGSGKITYGETLFFCIMLFGVELARITSLFEELSKHMGEGALVS